MTIGWRYSRSGYSAQRRARNIIDLKQIPDALGGACPFQVGPEIDIYCDEKKTMSLHHKHGEATCSRGIKTRCSSSMRK